MGCNGLCARFAIPVFKKQEYQKMKKQGEVFPKQRYTADIVRCSTCNVRVRNMTVTLCPCCHTKFRRGPHNRTKKTSVKRIDASDVEEGKLNIIINGTLEDTTPLFGVLEL